MKIAIIGAGSIGGLLGFRLAAAGNDVQLIARGRNLQAIKERGLTLIDEHGNRETRQIAASAELVADGYDAIVLGMKAHQVADVAPAVAAALTEGTTILTAQNGIPWWYFLKHGSSYEGTSLQSVDPDGRIRSYLPSDRIVGSVVYPAAMIMEPGVIKHMKGNRFSVGEIDGADTPRIRALSETLGNAGFKAPVLSDIRSEIWTKLWGNLSLNPISALTHATLAEICQHYLARRLLAAMMQEAQTVAESLGVRFKVSLEKRIAGAETVGAHKTSMLQDVEAGRQLELEALTGSVAELGRIAGISTPSIDAIYAATSLLATVLAANHGSLKIQPLLDNADDNRIDFGQSTLIQRA